MKNFIFASILLALLLTVNAAPFQLNKRAITFGPCEGPADLIDVKIGIDPPESGKKESFDVSGKLTKNDITNGKTILFIVYEDEEGKPFAEPYIQNFTDSIKAGNPFNISASDVPTPKLPDSYLLGVAVGDPFEDTTPFGCAVATVGNSSETTKFFDFYKLI
ncbi:hypothetical protein C2G38_2075976 [Gigaspora rosea]|uniref:MD-2-related lipid-recognition domain-containing protein n=1 Tax=Gigaspora rosea TaxID=44941 RepID=A0A397VIG6_9GLOM|nr:hypothetical protein C2G38_2075976 [Gigaspora rosea]